jgi:hypothetical protein
MYLMSFLNVITQWNILTFDIKKCVTKSPNIRCFVTKWQSLAMKKNPISYFLIKLHKNKFI